MRTILFVSFALLAIGCGQASPTAPTPPPPVVIVPPPTATPITITGTVTATNGGEAVAGATVSIAGNSNAQTAITDAAGRYQVQLPAAAITTASVTVTGPGIRTREFLARFETRTLDIDVIRTVAPFDATFFEMFVRASNPNVRLNIQPGAPRIYLRTIMDNGTPIDQRTLDATAAAIIEATPLFTGRFGIAGLERGTSDQPGGQGWITVRWRTEAVSGYCGETTIGGSTIHLFPNNPRCSCNGLRMAPRLVKHELGHTLGFHHTNHPDDVMEGTTLPTCNANPSSREQYHGAIAYRRRTGNMAPDNDRQANVILQRP